MNNNLARQGEYRSELIKGKIIMMSPSPITNHNRISRNITRIFDNYLDGKSCEVFADGLDVYLTAQDRFEPDCMVVCDPNKIKYNGVHGAPDLIVEVLSPSTAKNDKGHKKMFMSNAVCGNIGWLIQSTNLWSNISYKIINLSCTKFILYIQILCLRICPKKNGLQL